MYYVISKEIRGDAGADPVVIHMYGDFCKDDIEERLKILNQANELGEPHGHEKVQYILTEIEEL